MNKRWSMFISTLITLSGVTLVVALLLSDEPPEPWMLPVWVGIAVVYVWLQQFTQRVLDEAMEVTREQDRLIDRLQGRLTRIKEGS